MLIAVPIAIGTALSSPSSHPARPRRHWVSWIDVLAAVPSIIYGLWGLQVLMNHMDGITKWLNDYLGFIPLFNNEIGIYTKSIFIASVVLAIMILPTISALSREVFLQVPRDHRSLAGARGNPLGDDPHGGAAVQPSGHHFRHHAGPRASAR